MYNGFYIPNKIDKTIKFNTWLDSTVKPKLNVPVINYVLNESSSTYTMTMKAKHMMLNNSQNHAYERTRFQKNTSQYKPIFYVLVYVTNTQVDIGHIFTIMSAPKIRSDLLESLFDPWIANLGKVLWNFFFFFAEGMFWRGHIVREDILWRENVTCDI